MATIDISREAKAWVDNLDAGGGLAGSWRLQILEQRTRREDGSESDSFELVDQPLRVRRFAKGIPWAYVAQVVTYLHQTAPYTGLVFNGVPLEGRYWPTRTMWLRDDQTSVEDGRTRDPNRYTLVQDLVLDDPELDGLTHGSRSLCTAEISTRHVWDALTIESASGGGQGVTVTVQAVQRNDDGTFDYAVVTERAKTSPATTDPMWVVTACNEFETRETATWDNVYGATGAFQTDAGEPLNIPALCAADGVAVTLEHSRNADCTYRLVLVRTTAKVVNPADKTVTQDLFQRTERETIRAESESDCEVPLPGAGRVYSKRVQRREDGRYDVERGVETEESVDDAVVEYRKTLQGLVETREHRAQAEALPTPSAQAMVLGEQRRSTRTKGGLFDHVIVKPEVTSFVPLRVEVSRTKETRRNTVVGHFGDLLDNTIDTISGVSGLRDVLHSSTTTDYFQNGLQLTLNPSLGKTREVSVAPQEQGGYQVSIVDTTTGVVNESFFDPSLSDDGASQVSIEALRTAGYFYDKEISTPWQYEFTRRFTGLTLPYVWKITGNLCAPQDHIVTIPGNASYDTNELAPVPTELISQWARGQSVNIPAGLNRRYMVFLGSEKSGSFTQLHSDVAVDTFARKVSVKLSEWFLGSVDASAINRQPPTPYDDSVVSGWLTGAGKYNLFTDYSYPPSSHQVACSLSQSSDGMYSGELHFEARWDERSCGQAGVLGEGLYTMFGVYENTRGTRVMRYSLTGRGWAMFSSCLTGMALLGQTDPDSVQGVDVLWPAGYDWSFSFDPVSKFWSLTMPVGAAIVDPSVVTS